MKKKFAQQIKDNFISLKNFINKNIHNIVFLQSIIRL